MIFLLDRHVEYELVQRRMPLQADREPEMVLGVRFELGTVGVETIVFGKDGIRQAPVSPVDGRPMRRSSFSTWRW